MLKHLLTLSCSIGLTLSLFGESLFEEKLSTGERLESDLSELHSEINWLIKARQKKTNSLAELYRETGDLDALLEADAKLQEMLELMDKQFTDLRKSLYELIEIALGPAPQTGLVQLHALSTLASSYRQVVEESIFPENWKSEYTSLGNNTDEETLCP